MSSLCDNRTVDELRVEFGLYSTSLRDKPVQFFPAQLVPEELTRGYPRPDRARRLCSHSANTRT